jgi:hypothetical protein
MMYVLPSPVGLESSTARQPLHILDSEQPRSTAGNPHINLCGLCGLCRRCLQVRQRAKVATLLTYSVLALGICTTLALITLSVLLLTDRVPIMSSNATSQDKCISVQLGGYAVRFHMDARAWTYEGSISTMEADHILLWNTQQPTALQKSTCHLIPCFADICQKLRSEVDEYRKFSLVVAGVNLSLLVYSLFLLRKVHQKVALSQLQARMKLLAECAPAIMWIIGVQAAVAEQAVASSLVHFDDLHVEGVSGYAMVNFVAILSVGQCMFGLLSHFILYGTKVIRKE